MLKYFYNSGLFLWHVCVLTLSLFHSKARLFVRGRLGWKESLNCKSYREHTWAWFHCCSLGEYEDGKVFLQLFAKSFPQHKILLTFWSPSGYEARKNQEINGRIMYLPFDYSFNAKTFIDKVNVSCAFFIRNDIWLNYLTALKQKNIPVFHISTLLSKNSLFTKWCFRFLYKRAFGCFSAIFAQNEDTKNLLEQRLGITKVFVTGNTRADAVLNNFTYGVEPLNISAFIKNEFCIIGGSLLQPDADILLKCFSMLKEKRVKWIMVPHETDKAILEKAKTVAGDQLLLYSQINRLNHRHRLLWIDYVGILPFLYRLTNVAFVGGGFNRIGIHNILEPCVAGNAIFTGPNTRNYPEALALIRNGVCCVVQDEHELEERMKDLIDVPEKLYDIKTKAHEYILANTGASDRVLKLCLGILRNSEHVAVQINQFC